MPMQAPALFDPSGIWRALWAPRHLLWQWTCRLLAMRYTGSLLGPLWNVATPLLMLAVYTFVFGIVFKARWQMLDPSLETTESYAVILFCGMATFQIFSESVSSASRCILDNPNLVKKVIFPLEILPAAQTLAACVTGLIWLVLTLIAALCAGMSLHWTILLLPIALLPLIALALGMAWFVSACAVYLRDVPHLIALALQALFFMTPIFYPESLVPKNLAFILVLNPLAWLCAQFRDLLLFGVIPSATKLAITWIVCACICQLGFLWFLKVRKGFADVL